MRVLVVSARPDTASNRRLSEAATAAGAACTIADATGLVAATHGVVAGADGRPLDKAADVVLARVGNWRPDSLLAVLEALTARGLPTPNPAAAIRTGRDHWQTAVTLAAAGLPVPRTIAGADPEALASAARGLELPVVVKQRRSRMGVGVIRCGSHDHLEAVLDSLWRVGDEVVVQEYLETRGSSLRLLVVGGRVVAAARFTAVGDEWRSNAARGGEVVPWRPSPEEEELAVVATRAVGLGVCGVDLLPGPDRTVVGEVNPTPGFVHLERATGVDVATAIVDHLAATARSRPR
jgi:ribosomal protein S6--L-glutamate ligase